jgi:cysteine desulfurase / selenocysteine lyase
VLQNLKAGDRILLSVLEHHSNIVPWQLLRDRTGVAIDVCPLTEDGRIDLDAAERMLTPAHKLVALRACLQRARLGARRGTCAPWRWPQCRREDAARRLPGRAAHRLGRGALDAISTSFPRTSSMAPPASARSGRAELLDAMPPWHGGGAMIDRVTFESTTFAPAPQRFEAGTPAIVEAIGLARRWTGSAVGLDVPMRMKRRYGPQPAG